MERPTDVLISLDGLYSTISGLSNREFSAMNVISTNLRSFISHFLFENVASSCILPLSAAAAIPSSNLFTNLGIQGNSVSLKVYSALVM